MKLTICLLLLFVCSVATGAELTLSSGAKLQYVSAAVEEDQLVLTLPAGKMKLKKDNLSAASLAQFFTDSAARPAAAPAGSSTEASPSPTEPASPPLPSPEVSKDAPVVKLTAGEASGLAKVVLEKSGLRAGICEMPRAGDGAVAAALAQQGVSIVHALASDPRSAEAARKPSAASGVLGEQVIVETGNPASLPLGDWVADLYAVTDATDANLKSLSAAEAGRVLAPFRGVAVVGNPAGAKGGLSKAALAEWATGTGGTATIGEDANGLWAVVKMPPLKGGDDWGHYYHGPDGNPVSKDTAFAGKSYHPSSTVWRVTKSKDPLLMRVCGRAAASESKM